MDEIGHGAIALGIGLEVPAQRRPRAQVIPLEGAVGHDDILRVLHQCVVDRDLLELGILLGEDLGELGLEPALASLIHFRLMLLQSFRDSHE